MADDFLYTVGSDKGPVEPIPVTLVSNSHEVLLGSGISGAPKGYQQLTNAQLATVQSLTVPAGATVALIQNNGNQPARWRDDGVNPTSTIGQRIVSGLTLVYASMLSAFKVTREADGASLDIAYYG